MKSAGQAAYEAWLKTAAEAIGMEPTPIGVLEKAWPQLGPKTQDRFHGIAQAAYDARVAELNEQAGIRTGEAVRISEDTPTHHSYAMGIHMAGKSINLCLKDDKKRVAAVLNLTVEGAIELGRGLVRNLERLKYNSYAVAELATQLVVTTKGFAVASGPKGETYLMGGTHDSGVRSCIILDKPAAIRLRDLLKEAIEFDAEAPTTRTDPDGPRPGPDRPN